MTTRKKLAILALSLATAGLLFAQSRPTKLYSILIKSINALDTAFEIDLITGQTTNPITVKNPAGTAVYSITRLGAVSFSGAVTPTGGIVQPTATASCRHYGGTGAPATATTGTDTAGINGTVFVTELFVPTNCTVTGISYLIGSVGGTDKAIALLFNSAGAVLATSAVAGTTVGTTATMQHLDFITPYAAIGPGLYFVGVQYNGNTAKIRTGVFGDKATTSAAQTFGTPASITAPTTFTTALGPIVMTY